MIDALADLVHQGFPYAGAGRAASAAPLFGWHTLDGVLGGDEIPDVLVVARGALVPAPRSWVAPAQEP